MLIQCPCKFTTSWYYKDALMLFSDRVCVKMGRRKGLWGWSGFPASEPWMPAAAMDPPKFPWRTSNQLGGSVRRQLSSAARGSPHRHRHHPGDQGGELDVGKMVKRFLVKVFMWEGVCGSFGKWWGAGFAAASRWSELEASTSAAAAAAGGFCTRSAFFQTTLADCATSLNAAFAWIATLTLWCNKSWRATVMMARNKSLKQLLLKLMQLSFEIFPVHVQMCTCAIVQFLQPTHNIVRLSSGNLVPDLQMV